MNKKVLISLGIIAVIAIVSIGGTIAYFFDVETSVDNTFTAGAIDLKIDNDSYVTNEEGVLVYSPNTSWELDQAMGLFFNFQDLKPGDIGEDTISIRVSDNDAWACMSVELTATPENGETEPESEVDDGGDQGELQDELYFAFWADDGDNIYEEGEVIFAEGLVVDLFDGENWALADSQTNVWGHLPGTPITGGIEEPIYYIAKAWCYGELILMPFSQDPVGTPPGTPVQRGGTGFNCRGAQVSNKSQTDGIIVDVNFYAEQVRNNDNFICNQ